VNGDHAPDRLDELLRQLDELRDPDLDPELEAVRTAVLLEDSLDITLTDDEISPDVLSDPAAVRQVVASRDGGRT